MKVQRAVETEEGPGFVVDRVVTPRAPLEPFLLLDHFGPKAVPKGERYPAGPHPHRGFETITYAISGRMEHKDAWGNHGILEPGDVEWMRAGSGLVHGLQGDLVSDGEPIEGLQLWVNMPASQKMSQPAISFTRQSKIPTVPVDGGQVRVIAGEFAGTTVNARTAWPLTYLHVELDDGRIPLEVTPGDSAFAYVLRGSLFVDGVEVQACHRIQLTESGNVTGTGASFVFLAAKPIGEPIEAYGPFVMNTHEEIIQAVRDFQAGKMGSLDAELPGTRPKDAQMKGARK